jgi:CBS domain containing-hemolysin-like protein
LTGELEDEFDSPALPVLTTASGALLMDGGVNLRDLETQMQWDLPRDGGVETLAGFVLMRLGHIPIAKIRRRKVKQNEHHPRRPPPDLIDVRIKSIEMDSMQN